MNEADYQKLGAMKDREPCFMPDARGLFLITDRKRAYTEDETIQMNLHAQKELKAISPAFLQAQEWWSNLPKTPARQLQSEVATHDDPWTADRMVADWMAQYDTLDGLAYYFDIGRKMNLVTGETQGDLAMMDVGGMFRMPDFEGGDCASYRICYIFYEKPATVQNPVCVSTDSVTILRKTRLSPGEAIRFKRRKE